MIYELGKESIVVFYILGLEIIRRYSMIASSKKTKKSCSSKPKYLVLFLVVQFLIVSLTAPCSNAAVIKKWHNIPAYQQKNLFSKKKIKFPGLSVVEETTAQSTGSPTKSKGEENAMPEREAGNSSSRNKSNLKEKGDLQAENKDSKKGDVQNQTEAVRNKGKHSGNPITENPVADSVRFVIFDTTTQEIEGELHSENGRLPELNLVSDHNYIIYAEDSAYEMNDNVYIWAHGGKLLDIKNYNKKYGKNKQGKNVQLDPSVKDYPEVTKLVVKKRKSPVANPQTMRRKADIAVKEFINPNSKSEKGKLKPGIRFILVSDVETIEVTSNGSGRITPKLLEEVTYMVFVDDKKYANDIFPIAVKDKSEYGAGKYTYDHSSCHRVAYIESDPGETFSSPIKIYDKKKVKSNETKVCSLSCKTTVEGMNFKDFLISENMLSKSIVKGLNGKDYSVQKITAINPHRWEISKLDLKAEGAYYCDKKYFTISQQLPRDKTVRKAYLLKEDGSLQEIDFKVKSGRVNFKIQDLSITPVVLEYKTAIARPAKTKLLKVKGGKHMIKVTVKRQLKNSNGYQIQYGMKKNLKDGKIYTTKSSKKTSAKIKKLRSKKKYYVRARVYRNIKKGGKTAKVYSKWSNKKSVKVF